MDANIISGKSFNSLFTWNIGRLKYVYDKTAHPKWGWITMDYFYAADANALSQQMMTNSEN